MLVGVVTNTTTPRLLDSSINPDAYINAIGNSSSNGSSVTLLNGVTVSTTFNVEVRRFGMDRRSSRHKRNISSRRY